MRRLYYILGLAILVLLSLTVLAVQPMAAEDEPTPGVARVSLIHGDVTMMRGDSGDWVASTVNAPIVAGDRITTGDRSQTEIQLDYANILRLGSSTEVKVADLARTRIQVQVAQGLVNFSVLKGSEADAEIDTPNMAVRPLKEGKYRIQVNSASETQLIVRDGEAEVSTPQGSTIVKEGHIITVRGTENPEYQIAEAPRRDDWDKWNKERDQAIREARSWQYANHYYTGAQDLDRYGHWVYIPGYEWCWTPYVNLGWVPYRYGSWVWEPYWGWTWVSYEPWGWAPYHYGRWFWYDDYWYWWPGHHYYGYYPTWAPAYVSFLGFGFGGRHWDFGFGFGFGSIGWLPLGPYDYYHPWWGRHNTYNVVNVTNVTNVTNVYGERGRGRPGAISNVEAALTNARVREAITSVSTDDFVRGRVPRNPQVLDEATLRGGQVIQGTVPAVPTRESLRPAGRAANADTLARAGNRSENFFTRRQPSAGTQSFTEQAAGVQRMVQQHNPLQATGQGAAATTTRAAANRPELGQAGRAATNRTAPTQERGWQRFGGATLARANAAGTASAPAELAQNRVAQTGGRTQAQPAQQPSQQSSRNTWQRFGTGQPRAVPSRPTTTGAPQATEAAPARQGQGTSRQSTPQAPAEPSGRTFTRSAPTSESPGTTAAGWSRFSPQSESSTGTRSEGRFFTAPRSQTSAPSRGENPAFGQAPRSYERVPLQLRNPIVTERAPRTYGGGAPGIWSAPFGESRSWSPPSGNGRTWSAPSGGGRSTVAPPSRSSGSGSRGWSAPSGGGGGRSAPAAPSAGRQTGSRGRH